MQLQSESDFHKEQRRMHVLGGSFVMPHALHSRITPFLELQALLNDVGALSSFSHYFANARTTSDSLQQALRCVSRFVPVAIIQRMLNGDPDAFLLTVKREDCTVFFSDLGKDSKCRGEKGV